MENSCKYYLTKSSLETQESFITNQNYFNSTGYKKLWHISYLQKQLHAIISVNVRVKTVK